MFVPVRRLVPVLALALAAGAGLMTLSRATGDGGPPARPAGGLDLARVFEAVSQDGFEPLGGAWQLDLPADHGAHPEARTETWTLSAHLRDADGAEVGLQVALLRAGLVPEAGAEAGGEPGSAWDLRALHRGHVTLLDAAAPAATGEERVQRDLAGLAGHDAGRREIRLDGWSIAYEDGPGALRFEGSVQGTALALSLAPAKGAVAVGEAASAPLRGYAFTRLQAEGVIGEADERRPVSGFAWFDHVWGDVPLPLGPVVFDRLLLQLDDGTDLTVTRTRRRDGGGTPTLAGFAIDAEGGTASLEGVRLEMEPIRAWRRDAAGASYPVGWRLRAGDLALALEAVEDDQVHDFAAPIWSGLVAAEGMRGDRPVTGHGTLMLAGGTP